MVFLGSPPLHGEEKPATPRYTGEKSLLRRRANVRFTPTGHEGKGRISHASEPLKPLIQCRLILGPASRWRGALKTFRDRKLIGYEKSFSDFSSGI